MKQPATNQFTGAPIMKQLLSLTVTFFLCYSFPASAQNPVPAPAQSKRILITGATAHLGNGTVINNSVIGFADGKITLVGDATLVRIDNSQYDTILVAEGRHVYPGLIALNTQLGLNEIEAVRATRDQSETGGLNPSVRAAVAYNTDSKVIPTVRSNGILLAEIAPNGSRLSGQSSIMQLDAWNWEDAIYKEGTGIHMNWPFMRIFKARGSKPEEQQLESMKERLADIRQLFTEAAAYAKAPAPARQNLHLESMRGLFNGTKKIFVHCGYVKEIISAATFFKEFNIEMVLVGGEDAWMVTPMLKEYGIPVVIVNTHKLPSRDDEAIDLPFRLPYLLKAGGVKFAISNSEFWQVRNLPFQAGTAGAYGLTREEVLSSVTRDAADILGILSTTGTLETGKDATLFISEGDIFDMQSSIVTAAWINGRQISLESIQTALNRKYRNKYGLE
jgi:imidazolonepropionase-like amidohydrolase